LKDCDEKDQRPDGPVGFPGLADLDEVDFVTDFSELGSLR